MPLILRIKSGPLEGKTFPLVDGAVIGRGEVEISIPDAKISTRHAQIAKDQQGSWVITDLGSMNGLRIAGKKLAQITLTPDTEVLIGRTYFEVILEGENASVASSQKENNSDFDEITVPPLPAKTKENQSRKEEASAVIEVETQDWNDYLVSYCLEMKEKVSNKPRELRPFSPCLVLTFTRGIQAGTEWSLGYGPRVIGAASMDLPLLETPDLGAAFRLEPKGHKALFTTSDPNQVRLNGKSVASDELNDGDTLQIGQTQIRVGYRE